MSCSPQDFLTLAKRLSTSSDEIDLRCAVGRAYYAALHWAREAVDLCPVYEGADVGSHEFLIQRFLSYKSNKTAVGIGYMLRDMRNRRESADYDLEGITLAVDAQYQVREAERVRDKLRSFRQQHGVASE